MSLDILDQDAPGIAARVRALSPDRRRALAEAAARLALRARPVDDPRIDGDRGPLEALVEELDGDANLKQLAYDEAFEEGRTDAALEEAYEIAFERARAAAARLAALDPDPLHAAAEALYEANAALGHQPALVSRLVDAAGAGAADPAAGLEP